MERMLKINRIQDKELVYYEAIFNGQNLYTFSINDMIVQLWQIYGFKLSLFQFNLN